MQRSTLALAVTRQNTNKLRQADAGRCVICCAGERSVFGVNASGYRIVRISRPHIFTSRFRGRTRAISPMACVRLLTNSVVERP
jgi:hypothetical protein